MDWLKVFPSKRLQLIGQIVRRKGYVTEEQIREALRYQSEIDHRLALGEILVMKGFIDEETLLGAISSQCGLPCISPFNYEIDERLFLLIPKEIAEKYIIFPLDRYSDLLWLVVNDPYNEEMFLQVRDLTGCKIMPFLATKTEIKKAIEEFYG